MSPRSRNMPEWQEMATVEVLKAADALDRRLARGPAGEAGPGMAGAWLRLKQVTRQLLPGGTAGAHRSGEIAAARWGAEARQFRLDRLRDIKRDAK
jgi:hypothetical protein